MVPLTTSEDIEMTKQDAPSMPQPHPNQSANLKSQTKERNGFVALDVRFSTLEIMSWRLILYYTSLKAAGWEKINNASLQQGILDQSFQGNDDKGCEGSRWAVPVSFAKCFRFVLGLEPSKETLSCSASKDRNGHGKEIEGQPGTTT